MNSRLLDCAGSFLFIWPPDNAGSDNPSTSNVSSGYQGLSGESLWDYLLGWHGRLRKILYSQASEQAQTADELDDPLEQCDILCRAMKHDGRLSFYLQFHGGKRCIPPAYAAEQDYADYDISYTLRRDYEAW